MLQKQLEGIVQGLMQSDKEGRKKIAALETRIAALEDAGKPKAPAPSAKTKDP